MTPASRVDRVVAHRLRLPARIGDEDDHDAFRLQLQHNARARDAPLPFVKSSARPGEVRTTHGWKSGSRLFWMRCQASSPAYQTGSPPLSQTHWRWRTTSHPRSPRGRAWPQPVRIILGEAHDREAGAGYLVRAKPLLANNSVAPQLRRHQVNLRRVRRPRSSGEVDERS